jgi:hypothetical protein
LNTREVAAEKDYFGSATDNGGLTVTAYLAQLSNTADFGPITPGNAMKWDTIEAPRVLSPIPEVTSSGIWRKRTDKSCNAIH